MWLRLKSQKEGTVLLVSVAQVTHIAPREAGGSTVYFATETEDPKKPGQTKQRALAVRDKIDDIAAMLDPAKAR